MTKDEAKRIWGESAQDYPDLRQFIEARLLLTKWEADEAVSAALLAEQLARAKRELMGAK